MRGLGAIRPLERPFRPVNEGEATECGAPHGQQTADRGGLPFFQETSGHWEGLEPPRGEARGASPYFKAHRASSAPPREARGAAPSITIVTFSCGSGGLPLVHGEPDCRSCG